jgi:hypothetical protein
MNETKRRRIPGPSAWPREIIRLNLRRRDRGSEAEHGDRQSAGRGSPRGEKVHGEKQSLRRGGSPWGGAVHGERQSLSKGSLWERESMGEGSKGDEVNG